MKVGIIGCGAVAPKHADAYKKIEGVELQAVCDIVREKVWDFANGEYLPPNSYIHYQDMLRSEKLDLVSLCTPSITHTEIAIQCAETGVSVLCEKPIDIYTYKAQQMVDAFENSDAKLSIIFQNRWHPDVIRLRKEAYTQWWPIKANMTVNWFRPDSYFEGWKGILIFGGDLIFNQIIHHIDALRYIFGEVQSVFAYTLNTRTNAISCTDVCVATLKFKSGLLATLDATTNCYPKNERTELTVITDRGVKRIEPIGTPHRHQIRHVVDCISDGKQPEVTGADALKSLEVAVALHQSAFTGKEIKL